MLATPGDVPTGPGWSAEFKWDGMRALASSAGGRWRVLTRAGRDVSGAFPELSVLPDLVDGRTVTLDAEIVTLDPAGRPDFARLQRRMGVNRPEPGLIRQVPIRLYVFDLLHLDNDSACAEPYLRRRELLQGLALRGPVIDIPPHFPGAGADVLAVAAEQELEGVVCKRDDSRYTPGVRARTWVKTVIPHTAEVVICGWLPGRGRLRDSLGALLLGAYDRTGNLHYVGRVGTGLTGADRRRLLAELTAVRPAGAPPHAEAAAMAAATWVEPRLVASVNYRTWTPQSHLRHPSWRGLMPDHEPGNALLPDDLPASRP
ncbi:non-homologous end-joining DNA ligase [Actinoplanes sp. L3-i22]|uniref:non-homologous end-joining DNA ligase n=1 Tax=Actinoplanes sp. L3-i22 TaxID=2836373 RepID=UPI001C85FB9E|nr:non-homologous end-joining DNA ligase [Actinoplanes sp. L3-i22]